MKTMLDALNEYFENTSPEKIKSDWEAVSKWSDVGPSVEDYLKIVKTNMNVDLEEILKKSIGKNPDKHVFISGDSVSVEKCLIAMKAACTHVLYLAAENVKIKEIYSEAKKFEDYPFDVIVDRESILNTINQVK